MTRPAQPAPSHASLSPDGRHWWDGHEWVPNATEADWKEVAPPPPAATRATALSPPPAATPAAAYATWRSPYAPQPAAPARAAQPARTFVISLPGGIGAGAGLALFAGILGMVAALLPWASVFFLSVSGWDAGDGKYTFVAGLAAVAAGVLLGAIHGVARLLLALAGLASLGIAIYDLVRVFTAANPLGSLAPSGPAQSAFSVGAGIGLYLTAAAGALMIVAAWRATA